MPRPIEPQSSRFAQSPHAPRPEDIHDRAHKDLGNWDDHLDFENTSPGEYHRLQRQYDPHLNEEAGQALREAEDEALSHDEESGYKWGPPPNPHHIHDPGFAEHEVDTHPYA